MAIKLKAQEGQGVHLGVEDVGVRFGLGDHIEVVQSTDYNDLENKPQINGVTLEGNKTTEDLGIQAGVTSWNGQTGDVTYTPPVQSVNGQTGVVSLSIPTVPTNVSDFNNDAGYLTSSTGVTSVNGSTGAVTGLQTTGNLVTSVSSASTNAQYPSAKLFYDTVGDIETLLASI